MTYFVYLKNLIIILSIILYFIIQIIYIANVGLYLKSLKRSLFFEEKIIVNISYYLNIIINHKFYQNLRKYSSLFNTFNNHLAIIAFYKIKISSIFSLYKKAWATNFFNNPKTIFINRIGLICLIWSIFPFNNEVRLIMYFLSCVHCILFLLRNLYEIYLIYTLPPKIIQSSSLINRYTFFIYLFNFYFFIFKIKWLMLVYSIFLLNKGVLYHIFIDIGHYIVSLNIFILFFLGLIFIVLNLFFRKRFR